MAKTKVLVTVKTYPTLSQKYDELVCTAGFLEDGSWIRIYPMPFRKLDSGYKKWQWIELDLKKNESDKRKESFRPYDYNKIAFGAEIDTKNEWAERKKYAYKKVYTNMDKLIEEAKDANIGTSLAVFKPTEIIDFLCKPCERNWDEDKLKAIQARMRQGSLFETEEERKERQYFKVAEKIPYDFIYVFKSENGKIHRMKIIDWEVGRLYLRYVHQYKLSEKEACKKVKEKFFDDFAKKRDLHFFLGTTLQFHSLGRNPFLIIGTFTPPLPKFQEPSLFDLDFGND